MAAPIDPTEKPTKGFMDWLTVNTLKEVAFTRRGKAVVFFPEFTT